MRRSLLVVLFALLLVPGAAARADCGLRIQEIKGRIDRVSDKRPFYAVMARLRQAAREQRLGSETACLNDVTRAWRAYKGVLAAAATAPAVDPNVPLGATDGKLPPQVRFQ